jgi:ribose transport system substrate-binding protein
LTRLGASFAVLIAMATAVAACGSSDSSGGPTNASDTTSSATSSSTKPGVEAAKAYLAKYTDNPSSIGLPDLPDKPPADKTIISLLVSPQPVALRVSNAQKAAAEALGWNYSTVNAGSSQATAVSAFDAALAKHPDAICNCGFPAAYFTKQIKQAQEDGITVISNTTADGPTPGIIANVGGAETEAAYGKLTAAYFVANSDGTGKAAIFNIKIFPILAAYTEAFNAAVKEWCPDCETQYVDQGLTDVGTKTPQSVVAFFQRNPDYKWAVFGNGDITTGVAPALKGAGISGLNIIGEAPNQTNLASLKAGTETAWAGYPVDMLGWATMDILARHFANQPVDAAAKTQLPLQILTKDNIEGAVVDANGDYQSVDGFQDQFKKLWHVG